MKILIYGGVFIDRKTRDSLYYEYEPGGSALQTAKELGRLNMTVDLFGNLIGNDIVGRKLISDLKEHSLERYIVQCESVETPVVSVMIAEENGERTIGPFVQNKPNFLPGLVLLIKEQIHLETYAAAYFHPAALCSLNLARELREKQPHCLVFVTDIENQPDWLEVAHFVQLSFPADRNWNAIEIRDHIQNLFPSSNLSHTHFLITGGARGVCLLTPFGIEFLGPSFVGRVKDTTGAGDSFRAGFMETYLRTKDFTLSLKQGMRSSLNKILDPEDCIQSQEVMPKHCSFETFGINQVREKNFDPPYNFGLR